MADVKTAFGTSTSITITLNSLASGQFAGRESTVVDNTSNKFLDAHVAVTLVIGAGTIANDKAAYVYAYGSEDGTNYTDNATGSDAAITIRNPTNLRLVHVVAMPTQSLTYKAVFSVASAFGGALPRKWGIVVINFCGIALSASGNSATYSGIYATVV